MDKKIDKWFFFNFQFRQIFYKSNIYYANNDIKIFKITCTSKIVSQSSESKSSCWVCQTLGNGSLKKYQNFSFKNRLQGIKWIIGTPFSAKGRWSSSIENWRLFEENNEFWVFNFESIKNE